MNYSCRLSTKNMAMQLAEFELFTLNKEYKNNHLNNNGYLKDKELKALERIKEQIVVLLYTPWVLKKDNFKYLEVIKDVIEELVESIEAVDELLYENIDFKVRYGKEYTEDANGIDEVFIYHQIEHLLANKLVTLGGFLRRANDNEQLHFNTKQVQIIEKNLRDHIQKMLKKLKYRSPKILFKYLKKEAKVFLLNSFYKIAGELIREYNKKQSKKSELKIRQLPSLTIFG